MKDVAGADAEIAEKQSGEIGVVNIPCFSGRGCLSLHIGVGDVLLEPSLITSHPSMPQSSASGVCGVMQ